MPKYEWPTTPVANPAPGQNRAAGGETKVPLSITDPDQLRAALKDMLGNPEIADMFRDMYAEQLRAAGVDNIDRRYLHFPEAKKRFTEADLIDRRGWDIPEVRSSRLHLMGGWFRTVLFGTPLGESLKGYDLGEGMVRALSTTDVEGGYLIPPGFIAEITRDVPKISQLFQYVRKIPVPGNSGEMPKVGTNATVYWGSENTPIDEGDPAFLNSTYAVNRLNALVKLSREIANDSNPDIVQVVTELFQEAIAAERDRVIAIGSGSGRPLGLYSASGITNVAITSLTYTNMVKLKHSVDHRYHGDPSFRWQFNQNVLAALLTVLDGMNRPIFTDATNSEPAKILNTPFSVENSFPNNYVGIGCMRYYVWFDRRTMGVERTTEGGDAFAKHQLWVKFFERVDGKPVLPPTVPFARTRVLTGVANLGT